MFLGWDEAGWRAATSAADASSCLDAAAAWLLRDGPDLTGTLVALPGARAGRRLLERLVARAGEALVPPEITTAGQLTDALLELPRPRASGLARNLAWQLALAGLPPEQLAALWRARPADDDRAGWRALAEEARGRHAELGREGLGLHDVVPLAPPGAERARWQALAAAHEAYRRRLTALGLDDPHDARRQALAEGRLDAAARSRHARLVLVGVSELGGLNRRLLDLPEIASRSSALVCAPPSEQAAFDALGAVLPAAWARREIPLRDEQWHVAERPADAAARVVSVLASWGDRHRVEEVTLGVPGLGGAGDEIVPHLGQQLAVHEVATRPAVGVPLARTGPWRLVAAIARRLSRDRFEDLAALVRHPDLEAWLRARPETVLRETDLPACLDAYHARHLPGPRPHTWLLTDHHEQDRNAALTALSTALDELLAPLTPQRQASARAPLPAWIAPIREVLLAVYGDRDTEGAGDPLDEATRAALALLGKVFAEAEGVPGDLAEALLFGAGEALDALLASCAMTTLPPPARRDAVELLGWLELPLDDARATVIVNVEEGRLPEPAGGLPDGLRARLGMPDDALRLARDAHALTVILHARADCALITARRRQSGDPARPSRLLFHAPADVAARRVLRWAKGAEAADVDAVDSSASPHGPVLLVARPPLDRIRVTAFRDWFSSPYLFYLRQVLRVEAADDGAHEMHPGQFGTLLHEVLAALGEPRARDLSDEQRIAALLLGRLDELARAAFGAKPPPAVTVQLEAARLRLSAFARWQAQRRAEGWVVAATELSGSAVLQPADGRPVQLTGRLDRIDVRGEEWAILDYKTGDRLKTPKAVHGPKRDGGWRDVQLPLYRLLAADFARKQGLSSAPALAYVCLPRTLADTGLSPATWDEAELRSAEQAALDAIVAMRAEGAFAALGSFPEEDPILAALAGVGSLRLPDGGGFDESDDDESEDGA